MSAIFVVLPNIQNAKKIRDILTSHGFDQVIACSTGAAALGEMNNYDGGLVISGVKLPDMYYTDLMEQLPNYYELLLMGSTNAISAADGSVMAITMPIKVFDLVNTVHSMMYSIESHLRRMRKMKQKQKQRKQRTEPEENYIKNAKFLLMERNHLSEEEAHRYLQKCSMDNGTGLVETAQMVLRLIYDEA